MTFARDVSDSYLRDWTYGATGVDYDDGLYTFCNRLSKWFLFAFAMVAVRP
jgi:hypothetical protein